MTLGNRIKAIRLKRGETLEEFGIKIGTTKATVWHWEEGRNNPNKRNLKKIAELGGVSVERLINGANPLERYTDKELLEELLRRK